MTRLLIILTAIVMVSSARSQVDSMPVSFKIGSYNRDTSMVFFTGESHNFDPSDGDSARVDSVIADRLQKIIGDSVWFRLVPTSTPGPHYPTFCFPRLMPQGNVRRQLYIMKVAAGDWEMAHALATGMTEVDFCGELGGSKRWRTFR